MYDRTMRFGLGEEIEALRDMVRRFAAEEIAPRAASIDHDNDFPSDLWEKLGSLGLLGVTADPDYGGSGMGYVAHVIAIEEISRASASVGLSYGAHSNLCVNQIHRWGPPDQKTRYVGIRLRLRRGVDAARRREAQRPRHPQRLENVDHQRP